LALAPGTRVGAYEITGQLGAGGMGEVYRARDSKLKREVAIKVLPADVANDPERLARFQREAEVLASLNHPHIAHVYGIEGGALVMELVEGDDLSQRIAREPIPVDEALPIARQIAEALEAAHDAGIVHRDLKPANVKVRADGTVKVLDFGLAKALEQGSGIGDQGSGALANSPTITSPAMTMRGVILGTAAYMAPEQAKGRAVDKRADIWAFGCVLYEILTGRRAFQGEDATDTIAEVLKSSVNLAALPAAMPARVREVITRCLQRDPRMRMRDIGEARIALASAEAGDAPAVVVATRRPWREIAAWSIAALAIVAAVLAVRSASNAALPPHLVRFKLDVRSDPSAAGVTAVVSPDGTTIALQPNGPNDGIYLRRLDSEQLSEIEGTKGARGIAWSNDSRSIAFAAGGQLKMMRLGESPRVLAAIPEGLAATAVAFGSTGTIVVAFSSGPLRVLRGDTGALEPLFQLDDSVGETEQGGPVFHPDGRRLFYFSVRASAQRGLWTRFRAMGSADFQELPSSDTRIIWAGDEHVVFRRGTTLVAQRISYASLSLQGAPVQIANDVEEPPALRAGNASASPASLVYRTLTSRVQQMTWVARDGRIIAPVGPAGQYPTFALSRDGARIAVSRRDGAGQNIWVMDSTKGTMGRATIGAVVDVDPRIGPDGKSVIFGSTRDRFRSPYRVAIAGGQPERVMEVKNLFALDDWSADGRWLLYHFATSTLPPAIQAIRLDQLDAPPLTVATALTGTVDQAMMSADGRWVAYNSTESGRSEVFVVPFPPTGDRWQVSINGGAQPNWRQDGRELFYLALDGTVMAAPIRTTPAFDAGQAVALFRLPVPTISFSLEQYAAAPDGTRFLYPAASGDLSAPPLTVLANWQSLLQ
jgi:hypothetical protein